MVRVPYTYRIGWSTLGLHYYGVRYAAGCNPSELMVTYFTSSKHVKNMIQAHGMPDIVQIRKVFVTVSEARLHEHKVLKRLRVTSNQGWINKTDNVSFDPSNPHHGWTKASREKSARSHTGKVGANRGKVLSEETKDKMRQARLGKRHSEETKKLMSARQKARGGYGPRSHTTLTKQKMSLAHKGIQ